MRWLIPTLLVFLLVPTVSAAQTSQRLNVRLYDGNAPGIIFHDTRKPSKPLRACFPYSCVGIGPTLVNPSVRKEEEKPSCYYGTDDVLFYEKEGSVCSYNRPKSNSELRVEKRRAEAQLRRTRSGRAE